MTPDAIAAAVAAQHMPGLRAAFDAFVAYPDEPTLTGFADTDAVFASFDSVLGILQHDFDPMPDPTYSRMIRIAAEGYGGLLGSGYGHAAQAAIRCNAYFRERFNGLHPFTTT